MRSHEVKSIMTLYTFVGLRLGVVGAAKPETTNSSGFASSQLDGAGPPAGRQWGLAGSPHPADRCLNVCRANWLQVAQFPR